MCFALMNTSPWISGDRVPTISRVAEGQWRSEITKEEQRSLQEVFNVIQCDIQTEELPPQHAEVIYYNSGYIE